VAQAQMAIERLRIQGKILPTNDYVTKIAIEIDTDGNLREVRLLESCGVPLLDDAPKKAFWDAQPFRNPPKGLFQGEPTFIIPFQFHYQWRTSGINFGRSSP
jgi:TonB family protein